MSQSDAQRYFELLRRDEQTLQLLSTSARTKQPAQDVSDWIVTLHFYVLCVYVKALGRCRGREFQDHLGLRTWLNTEADLLAAAKPYRKTEEWSRDARYEGRTFKVEEIRILHRWFKEARDIILGLLRKQVGGEVPVVEPVSL